MSGLKNVRNRRTDALTQVGWAQLETMLAVYYRGQGYRVDHVGTGGSGTQFDGGIDLKLHKDDAYIVVQCKHWNAKQVAHNAVHELIGVMVTERATGAILITSGEFTRYAIESAAKHGHIQLVDGDDLRGMLGALPEQKPAVSVVSDARSSMMGGIATHVGERLLDAAEDRIRGSHRGQRRGRGALGHAMSAGLGIVLLKLAFALIVLLIFTHQIQSMLHSLLPAQRVGVVASPSSRNSLPMPARSPDSGVLPSMQAPRGTGPVLIDHFTGTTVEEGRAGMPAYRPPTAAEQRESRRKADEAIRILEASTPEM